MHLSLQSTKGPRHGTEVDVNQVATQSDSLLLKPHSIPRSPQPAEAFKKDRSDSYRFSCIIHVADFPNRRALWNIPFAQHRCIKVCAPRDLVVDESLIFWKVIPNYVNDGFFPHVTVITNNAFGTCDSNPLFLRYPLQAERLVPSPVFVGP